MRSAAAASRDLLVTGRVAFVDFLEHVDLELGGVAILLDILDDLQRDVGVTVLPIATLHHFAERSFAQLTHNLVCESTR